MTDEVKTPRQFSYEELLVATTQAMAEERGHWERRVAELELQLEAYRKLCIFKPGDRVYRDRAQTMHLGLAPIVSEQIRQIPQERTALELRFDPTDMRAPETLVGSLLRDVHRFLADHFREARP